MKMILITQTGKIAYVAIVEKEGTTSSCKVILGDPNNILMNVHAVSIFDLVGDEKLLVCLSLQECEESRENLEQIMRHVKKMLLLNEK
jgi:hypothetical protein